MHNWLIFQYHHVRAQANSLVLGAVYLRVDEPNHR